MNLWLYLDGEKSPIRGFSDANGNIIDGMPVRTEFGETFNYENKIDLSKVLEVKIRTGWDGFYDGDFYGEINIRTLK